MVILSSYENIKTSKNKDNDQIKGNKINRIIEDI